MSKYSIQKILPRKWFRRNYGILLGTLLFVGTTTFVISTNGLGLLEKESITRTIQRDETGKVTGTVETITTIPGKTLWDWLGLMGVPLVLAILGYWLQQQQQKRSQALSQEQQEIAANEAKEEILQTYFDRISTLLIDKNILAIAAKVHPSEEAQAETLPQVTPEERELLDAAIDIIRARTLSILRRFDGDGDGKASVLHFLSEAEVLSKTKMSLLDADFSGSNLSGTNLSNTNLSGANFRNSNLRDSNFSNANLKDANLSDANLVGANLSGANLSSDVNFSIMADPSSDANLVGANLSGADLACANLTRSNLVGTNLSDADLSDADLSGSTLMGALFSNVTFDGANLSNTNLSDANLSGINLSSACLARTILAGANLRASSLNGATLFQAHLNGANLRDANLRNADLSCANLCLTQLRDTDIAGITWDINTQWPSPEEVAKAKNIPETLKQKLGITDVRN
jgi:uncharacterized protein YjbI with pentapeptide repeats